MSYCRVSSVVVGGVAVLTVGVGAGGAVDAVSLPSEASRNSLMPLPSELNTWGNFPAPNTIKIITKSKISSGGPTLITFLLSRVESYAFVLYHFARQ